MIKKKRAKKSEAAGKKSAKKKGESKKTLKARDPEQVRENISKMVQEQAEELAEAVIGVGMTGQLAPVKFLFEMAHVYPKAADGSDATKDEDCLAKTLLNHLHISDTPVGGEDDEFVASPEKKEAETVQTLAEVKDEEVPVG